MRASQYSGSFQAGTDCSAAARSVRRANDGLSKAIRTAARRHPAPGPSMLLRRSGIVSALVMLAAIW